MTITRASLACLPLLAMTLVGCGGDSKVRTTQPQWDHATFQPGTHPIFDPAASQLPFNNDLIFLSPAAELGAAFDGTAHAGAPDNPVVAALNRLDGFSTNAPFDILLSGGVNPASVLPGQTVLLLELTSNGEVLDPSNVTGVAGAVSIATTVLSQDGGQDNVIRVTPQQPLKAATKYLVLLTNNIVDQQGEPLTASWTYNALKGTSFKPSGSLATVGTLVKGWELIGSQAIAAGSGGTVTPAEAADSLVLSYSFTTTDPVTPLVGMAAPGPALLKTMMDRGMDQATAAGNLQLINTLHTLSTPVPRALGLAAQASVDLGGALNLIAGAPVAQLGQSQLYTGHITLPYYLDNPADNPAYTQQPWTADTTLGAILGGGAGGGALPPADKDGSYNVTYRYPFAAERSQQTVPLQLVLPNAGHVSSAGADCDANFAQQDGYPVALYVHGITSDRTSAALLAYTLADHCIATVAIDLPLHGAAANSPLNAAQFQAAYPGVAITERHFGEASGSQFINLPVLANTRDNLRQGVMDLLNLNASLPALNGALASAQLGTLDLDQLYLVGVSLGSMVGTVAATVNELAIGAYDLAGMPPALHSYKGVLASVGGAQLTQVLLASDSFGPTIIGGLAQAGVHQGTSNFERFIYAAQSMVDSGDPVNFAGVLKGLGVPVVLQQVSGDQVVPNSVTDAPLAGTAGLASLLDAQQIGVGQSNQPHSLIKMIAGGHSSLMQPTNMADQTEKAVTGEMQAQVVSFILGQGAVAVGSIAPALVGAP